MKVGADGSGWQPGLLPAGGPGAAPAGGADARPWEDWPAFLSLLFMDTRVKTTWDYHCVQRRQAWDGRVQSS